MKIDELINTYKEKIESYLGWINLKNMQPYGREFLTYMGDIKLHEGLIDMQLIGKHLENEVDYIGFQTDFIRPTTYDEKGIPTEHRTTVEICEATIKDNKIIESNFNELENKLKIINCYICKELRDELENICNKYKFKFKEKIENKIALCAKDTDRHWQEWIILDLKNKDVKITGNTDNCNFWFCDTRKDLTPERITNFTGDLNGLLRRLNVSVKLKTLIDPEDWQEIAKVNDAYNDNRYNIQFHDVAFGDDNYIYFNIENGDRGIEGLFRIHDLENGSDMTLVSMDCRVDEDKAFADAHWEEIEEKLCEYAKQRQEKIEKSEEQDI